MANELRVRANFIAGLIEDNPLTAAATTLTSADLASLPAIGATEHAVIVLDPDGTPEIVYVTAHTAAATTATILRAQEGTVAVEHLRDTPWIHGPVTSDFSASSMSYFAIVSTTATDNPTPVENTLVNGMTLSIPSSATNRLALVSVMAFFDASHPNRFLIYLNGTNVFPNAAGNPGQPSVDDGSSSDARWFTMSNVPIVLDANTAHTIELRYNASDSTAATTFNHRYIVAVVSAAGSTSPVAF